MNQRRGRAAKISFWIALGLTAILILMVLVPIPKSQTTRQGNTTFTLRVNRQIVLFPGSCVRYGWNVENIQAIWWNGSETVGSRETNYCTPSVPSTLTVTFQDGTRADYTLPIIVLTQNTLARGTLFFIIALYIIAAIIWLAPKLTTSTSAFVGFVRVVEIIVIWVVIILVLLEGGTRLWVRFTLSEIDRMAYFSSPDEIFRATNLFVEVPYAQYVLSPNANDTINNMGFRGEHVSLEKPPEAYRIIALGGSTTYGDGLDHDESWPAQLETVLHEDYGYDQVEVINSGLPMYTSFESFANFSYRGLELQPDMVIVYHAINDAILMTTVPAECWRGENLNIGLGSARDVVADLDNDLPRSVFQRYVAIQLGFMSNPLTVNPFILNGDRSSVRLCPDIAFDFKPDNMDNINPTNYYERNIRNLVAVARANDVEVVLSTWASRGSHQPASGINYLDATHDVNETTREITTSTDAKLIDLAVELPFNADYWQEDEIHQTAAGTCAQAEIYAAALHESGLIPMPDAITASGD